VIDLDPAHHQREWRVPVVDGKGGLWGPVLEPWTEPRGRHAVRTARLDCSAEGVYGHLEELN
jgi:hypothetical protein